MSSFTFQSTALVGTNKVGKLKPDENGYYPVVLGAFDCPNPNGDIYTFNSAKKLFTESSTFMRNILAGNMYGEWGHPKRQPGQTLAAYIKRCMIIDETNIAFHVKKVAINDTDVKDKNGNVIISVIGWIKPVGPKAAEFREMLENPDQNVSFSVRCTTDDVPNGRGTMNRNVLNIICWDFVIHPGLEVATKYHSPALESYSETRFDSNVLMAIKAQEVRMPVGMESDIVIAKCNEILSHAKQVNHQGLNAGSARSMDW